MGVFLRGAPGPRAAGAALGSALEAAQARPGWAEAPPAGPGRAYQPALPVGILTASAWRVAGRPHVSAHVAWLGFCYGLGWVSPCYSLELFIQMGISFLFAFVFHFSFFHS